MPILTDANLLDLIHDRPITEQLPWASRNDALIIDFYQRIIRDVRATHWLGCRVCADWGSGDASFVDALFYREPDYRGLAVYFSKLSPYYVIGEGRKGGFNLDYAGVDTFAHRNVERLVAPVCAVLDSNGLIRLSKADLGPPLPGSCYGAFYTMITQPPWRHFDALFHWVD